MQQVLKFIYFSWSHRTFKNVPSVIVDYNSPNRPPATSNTIFGFYTLKGLWYAIWNFFYYILLPQGLMVFIRAAIWPLLCRVHCVVKNILWNPTWNWVIMPRHQVHFICSLLCRFKTHYLCDGHIDHKLSLAKNWDPTADGFIDTEYRDCQ